MQADDWWEPEICEETFYDADEEAAIADIENDARWAANENTPLEMFLGGNGSIKKIKE